jgi:pimeloyl-ACP methyl ester carboxylesterase
MPASGALYYLVHASGDPTRPPLVLIHNLGGSSLDWPPEIRRLSAGRIFALDLPGHGKSAGAGQQAVDGYAQSLAAFLNELNLKRAVVVGHGLGGAIALELGRRCRARLAGLCLINSGARLPVPGNILENVAHPSTRPLAVQALTSLLSGPQTPAPLVDALTGRLNAVRPSVLHADLQACDAFDFTRHLKRIPVPVLVIGGTEDRFTPPAFAQALAASLPHAALQMIDGASHLAPWEEPRRIAALLDLFTATLR